MICFGTPQYAGQCTSEFFRSSIELARDLGAAGVPFQWIVTDNESLVQRARNTTVARYLQAEELKDFDRFMFIDADIEYTSEDVMKLYALDADIATAAYPMKREGSDVTAWKDGELVDLDKFDGPTPIDYAGTGFLMIKRRVFEKIISVHPQYEHREGKVGKCWAIFDCAVQQDDDGIRWYRSEDYTFCHRARRLGFKIMLEPSIRLGHVGRRVYR